MSEDTVGVDLAAINLNGKRAPCVYASMHAIYVLRLCVETAIRPTAFHLYTHRHSPRRDRDLSRRDEIRHPVPRSERAGSEVSQRGLHRGLSKM